MSFVQVVQKVQFVQEKKRTDGSSHFSFFVAFEQMCRLCMHRKEHTDKHKDIHKDKHKDTEMYRDHRNLIVSLRNNNG